MTTDNYVCWAASKKLKHSVLSFTGHNKKKCARESKLLFTAIAVILLHRPTGAGGGGGPI